MPERLQEGGGGEATIRGAPLPSAGGWGPFSSRVRRQVAVDIIHRAKKGPQRGQAAGMNNWAVFSTCSNATVSGGPEQDNVNAGVSNNAVMARFLYVTVGCMMNAKLPFTDIVSFFHQLDFAFIRAPCSK